MHKNCCSTSCLLALRWEIIAAGHERLIKQEQFPADAKRVEKNPVIGW